MDPLSAVFILATWFAARSSEEFAAEFGKDLYARVSPLVTRLMDGLSVRKDASKVVAEVETGDFSDSSIRAISEVLNEDRHTFAGLPEIAQLLHQRQRQFYIEQDFDSVEDAVGLKAPNATAAGAEIIQKVKEGKNIRGVDLT